MASRAAGGWSGTDGQGWPETGAARERSVTIGFSRGIPVAVDGRALTPAALIAELNRLGGRRTSGDLEAGSWPGNLSRDAAWIPAARLLAKAHRDLERRVLDSATQNRKDLLAHIYADVVYNGTWFSPLREALDAFVTKTQEPVTGEIRVHLDQNSWNAANDCPPSAHSDAELAARGADDVYHQAAAIRFMHLEDFGQNTVTKRGRRLRERDMVILK
jgi:argininosuccinate synthase